MKSNVITISAFLAAIAALFLLPLSAAAAAMAVTATGVLSVFVADYGRAIEPVRLPARIVPFESNSRTPAGLGEAA